MEELGTIGYGKLKFYFNLSPGFSKFAKENEMSNDYFIISSQSFYQGILFKFGIEHTEEKEIEIVFYGLNSNKGSINDEIDKSYIKFESFPLGEMFVDFGAKLK